ncbi:MAG TPA: BatA domain-containing protein [Vicinamibacterales bacterium]
MIAWLNAAALWGLTATFGAVLVHLLFRRRARRVPFPTLRFVSASFTSAMRPRRPTDAALLAVRIATLAAAAAALAQPLLVTPARARTWNARIARAIVVDTSRSMAPSKTAVETAVRAESVTAVASSRIETPDVARGVVEATLWLASAPPARREIVVVSDMQRESIREADIARVPAGIGLRFIKTGALPPERDAPGVMRLDEARVAATRVRVSGAITSASAEPTTRAAEGLEIIAPARSDEAVRALRRIVSAAGTPAPSAREPIVVMLRGARLEAQLRLPPRAWMMRALERVQADGELQQLGESVQRVSTPPWVTILEDTDGAPLVRAAAAGERLVLDVAADPSDYLAAAVLRAALVARSNTASLEEAEVLPVADDDIARWRREPAPVTATDAAVWQHARSDARWFWGLALVLLAVEGVMRRQRTVAETVDAHAA